VLPPRCGYRWQPGNRPVLRACPPGLPERLAAWLPGRRGAVLATPGWAFDPHGPSSGSRSLSLMTAPGGRSARARQAATLTRAGKNPLVRT
jgi:hypothetical protein